MGLDNNNSRLRTILSHSLEKKVFNSGINKIKGMVNTNSTVPEHFGDVHKVSLSLIRRTFSNVRSGLAYKR